MAWLDDNPPASPQFRDPRRDKPSGVIALHTAESVMDTVGPDTGAENVARFIRTRTNPGSYHDLCDSDSDVHLVRYDCEAFHDGTGTNRHSLGLAFACSYLDWPRMSATRRAKFLDRAARRAVRMAQWVKAETGVVIPARKISATQARDRVPGFVYHANLDPTRRRDPGVTQFPLAAFLDRYRALSDATPPPAEPLEASMIFHIKDSPYTFLLKDAGLVPLREAEFWTLAGAGVAVKSIPNDQFVKLNKQIAALKDRPLHPA